MNNKIYVAVLMSYSENKNGYGFVNVSELERITEENTINFFNLD